MRIAQARARGHGARRRAAAAPTRRAGSRAPSAAGRRPRAGGPSARAGWRTCERAVGVDRLAAHVGRDRREAEVARGSWGRDRPRRSARAGWSSARSASCRRRPEPGGGRPTAVRVRAGARVRAARRSAALRACGAALSARRSAKPARAAGQVGDDQALASAQRRRCAPSSVGAVPSETAVDVPAAVGRRDRVDVVERRRCPRRRRRPGSARRAGRGAAAAARLRRACAPPASPSIAPRLRRAAAATAPADVAGSRPRRRSRAPWVMSSSSCAARVGALASRT